MRAQLANQRTWSHDGVSCSPPASTLTDTMRLTASSRVSVEADAP